ncbi:MAG: hypothetical protein ACP5H3_04035 [Candidatus Aenigmatarchaeota archaeon]|jgi:SOS response regulatory protein OraA/RecX
MEELEELEGYIFSKLRKRLEEKGYSEKEINFALITLTTSPTFEKAKEIIDKLAEKEMEFLEKIVEKNIEKLREHKKLKEAV